MGGESSQALKWSLRVMAGLSAAIGAGFIIWGCVIQNPPEIALTIGMVILGSLALVVGVLGFLSSFLGRWCLSVLLFVALLINLGELALVISLLADLDKAVNSLVDSDLNQPDVPNDNKRLLLADTPADLETKYRKDLDVARYIFLVFCLLELLSIIATIIIKVRHPYEHGVDGDEEDQLAAKSAMAQIQLEGLKNSVKKSDSAKGSSDGTFYTSSKKMYKSVTRKMTQKYGEFTSDPAFQKKWWQNIPGFR